MLAIAIALMSNTLNTQSSQHWRDYPATLFLSMGTKCQVEEKRNANLYWFDHLGYD